MKKIQKRLQVARQTVKQLSGVASATIRGGIPVTISCHSCDSCFDACTGTGGTSAGGGGCTKTSISGDEEDGNSDAC